MLCHTRILLSPLFTHHRKVFHLSPKSVYIHLDTSQERELGKRHCSPSSGGLYLNRNRAKQTSTYVAIYILLLYLLYLHITPVYTSSCMGNTGAQLPSQTQGLAWDKCPWIAISNTYPNTDLEISVTQLSLLWVPTCIAVLPMMTHPIHEYIQTYLKTQPPIYIRPLPELASLLDLSRTPTPLTVALGSKTHTSFSSSSQTSLGAEIPISRDYDQLAFALSVLLPIAHDVRQFAPLSLASVCLSPQVSVVHCHWRSLTPLALTDFLSLSHSHQHKPM